MALCSLLIALSSFRCAEGKKRSSGGGRRGVAPDKLVKDRRRECEGTLREGVQPCERSRAAMENCILRCVSPKCYDKVYGEDPLEEGEVDDVRGSRFRSCAKNEHARERHPRA